MDGALCIADRGVGLVQMQRGLTDYAATGTMLYRAWYLTLLAEAYGHEGEYRIGLETLADAMTLVCRGEGDACWEPELHRLKGELLLQQSPDNVAEAATCFQQAISIAQDQSAKSWELRASTSLAKLWQQQGKRKEAYDLLAPVYGWFTEGFGTADLIDAKILLDELSSTMG